MSDKESLAKIGIKDQTFDFLTVAQLVKRGIIEKPLDGNHGEIHPKGEDFVTSGIPFIMASDINDGVVDYIGCKFIARKQADSLRKGFARSGDVLLTHKATIGRTAIVKYDEQPYVMLTPQVTYYRVSDHQKLNHRYLRYYFESSFFQDILSLWAGSGSTRAYLGITEQGKLPFVLPPINKQKKIAAILSAYDELIENNQRRITLLEKMAEEIYREWFVRLRFPGHEKVKFLKGVPEGWRAVQFTEICEFQKGKTPDQTFLESQDGLLPYITVEFIEGKNTEYVLKKRNSIVCENGDVLMLMDGARSGLVFRGKKGIVGSTFARVAVEPLYRDVVYEFLRATREHIVSNNTGSAIPHANKEFIHRLMMFLPENENLIEKFNDYYRSLFEQSLNLVRQNELLSRSRDALLPRLISGKLSVENLDIQFPPNMAEELKDELTANA